jgi:hypothetical protein
MDDQLRKSLEHTQTELNRLRLDLDHTRISDLLCIQERLREHDELLRELKNEIIELKLIINQTHEQR